MKVVAGMDGQNAKKFADRLKKYWPMKTEDVYKMALKLNFGSIDCLVVITDSEVYSKVDGEISKLYRTTFQKHHLTLAGSVELLRTTV